MEIMYEHFLPLLSNCTSEIARLFIVLDGSLFFHSMYMARFFFWNKIYKEAVSFSSEQNSFTSFWGDTTCPEVKYRAHLISFVILPPFVPMVGMETEIQ